MVQSVLLYVLYNKEIEDRIIICLSFYLKMVGKINFQKSDNRYEVSFNNSLWFVFKMR